MTQESSNADRYDVIIVGAGAAGCVLAGRLSEISSKRVLLIEAGPDAPPGREHLDIRDAYPAAANNPRFFWAGLTAEMGPDRRDGRSRTSVPYRQAFGVGGGSNVNGMIADRGLPSDYDEWGRLGASGWGWEQVLPYFKKLEHDMDFSGPLHGDNGPIPVCRAPINEWAPFTRALANACERRGILPLRDSNAEFGDGLSSVPMNCLADGRVSASMAYLTPEVRQRPNLTIFANTVAERLDIHEGSIRGVYARTSQGVRTFVGREIIVSCGAVYSPALLMRSGIGPAEQLQSLGIETISNMRGVGQNLQNHPALQVAVHLKDAGSPPPRQRSWVHSLLRYTSMVAGSESSDLLLLTSTKAAWHSLGRHIAVIGILVQKSYSTGYVDLVSSDASVAPRVRFNALDDTRDFERLVEGLRFVFDILGDNDVKELRNEVFAPNFAVAARLARRSAWNALRAWPISAVLQVSSLRRAMLRDSTIDVDAAAKDDGMLRRYVRKHTQVAYHACGTCKMGSAEDRNAVVDSGGRVFGLKGLRVVDASVFPSIPRACTHLPVLMVAEKMADRAKAELKAGLLGRACMP